MTAARDRADRKGSTPIQIGNTKLTTDSSNNLNVLDNSDSPKKLIASEIEIGDSSNKVIIKKGSNNKVAFQTQASGGSAQDSNAGGGVTVVADLTALQALTGMAVGDLAFVTANQKLYLRQTNGFYAVATVTNATPVISSAGNASYTFATDGTPIVVTVTATDAEGETITYGHTVTGSASGIATITQGTGGNVNQFTLTPATSGSGGSFSVTFTAQDPNGNTATSSASSFSLSFIPQGSTVFDGSGDALETASSSTLNLGTGDFTLEFWVYPNNLSSTQIITDRRLGGGGNDIVVFLDSSSKVNLHADSSTRITSSSSISASQWTHISVVKSSGTTKLYIGGTADSTTYSDSNNYYANQVTLGKFYNGNQFELNGYISNYREVKGTAVYTSNFTPPTSPLSAITNTILLTCQNNTGTITDSSSNNFTITAFDNAAASSSHPF